MASGGSGKRVERIRGEYVTDRKSGDVQDNSFLQDENGENFIRLHVPMKRISILSIRGWVPIPRTQYPPKIGVLGTLASPFCWRVLCFGNWNPSPKRNV